MNTQRLKYARLAPQVWAALELEVRKGWVLRGVIDPETVAEHTLDMLRIGDEVAREINLPEDDRADLLGMLEIHDWPEALNGDEITMHGVDLAKEADAKKAKFLKEEAAMKSICEPLGEEGVHIFALWYRFETSGDDVAILAREIDKEQAIEQAFRYERSGQGPEGLGEEFVRYSPPIRNPYLAQRIEALRATA